MVGELWPNQGLTQKLKCMCLCVGFIGTVELLESSGDVLLSSKSSHTNLAFEMQAVGRIQRNKEVAQ